MSDDKNGNAVRQVGIDEEIAAEIAEVAEYRGRSIRKQTEILLRYALKDPKAAEPK